MSGKEPFQPEPETYNNKTPFFKWDLKVKISNSQKSWKGLVKHRDIKKNMRKSPTYKRIVEL